MTEDETWYIRLSRYHYEFFKRLAKKAGDSERGAEARQCRLFLKKKITEDKQLLDLAYELQNDMVFQDENAFDTDAVKRTANKWLEKSSDIIAEVED